jgi:4-amino-4-deoxy-L-arabinose transferase-like glycosyltransferase
MQAHAEVLALGGVLLVGLLLRLAFAFRAPVLVLGDSETYLGPALDLERGSGFDLALKRTPGYPVLISATLALFGEDLRTLAFVQHGLGLITVLLAYLLARRLAGRVAGVLAGLATALAGHLLIYERLIMTETFFTTLQAAAVLGLVVAAERRSPGWLLLAGVAIGAATLVRPVAQALLLLAPLSLLLAGRAWRQVLIGTLVVGLGYALVLGPWTLRGAVTGDGAAVGALGQTLVGRTARHDRRDVATDSGFVFYDPARDAAESDPVRLAARRILQEAANRGSSGRAVHTRLRRELGLSEAAADRLMRDLAIEAILQRPGYYLSGTLQRFVRLWVTPLERLSGTWNDRNTIRRAWEHASSAELLEQPPGPIERELPYAEALAGLFQPGRLGLAFPLLFGLGLVAALLGRRYRLALVPAAAVLGLMGLSVALVGGVTRYRYPEDPLIFVIIAVGLVWAAGRVGKLRRHDSAGRELQGRS